MRITRSLPRRSEVNPNSWGQDSFQSIGSVLWGTVPPSVVRGQRAVCSAGHPKSLYHPYRSLLHDRRPLAGLVEFVAAGSGELRAQAGRGGIGFWGDSSRESPAWCGKGSHQGRGRWRTDLWMFSGWDSIRLSSSVGHLVAQAIVPISLCLIVLLLVVNVWNGKEGKEVG